LKTKSRRQRIIDLQGYLFVSPIILGVLLFTYIPAVQSLFYSFFDFNGFSQLDFVGLKNFITILSSKDIESGKVFANTFLYSAIIVPFGIVIGYLLALAVNIKLKGIRVYRLLYYLPCIIPGIVSGILWRDLFDAQHGLFNRFLSWFGMHSPFFTSAKTAMATLVSTSLWGMGGGMVIWLAALKNIPESLYESAKLDGANAFQRLIKITIPMSSSVIFYNLVVGVIGSLQTFATFIIAGGSGAMAGRGPADSLYFLSVKIYTDAFTRYRMGYACALGWILFVIIAVLTVFIFKTSGWVQYMDEA